MATYGTQVRRGLPRRPGGDPWPAGGDGASPQVVEGVGRDGTPAAGVGTATIAGSASMVRRGLPRTQGGEPWPPASSAAAETATSAPATPQGATSQSADITPAAAAVAGTVASAPATPPSATP